MNTDDQVIALLEELLAWTKFANRGALVETLKAQLAEPRHLRAYEFSDGTKTQKEVGDLVGLSQQSISALWQKWRRLGIAKDQAGRAKHIARPTDLGLTVLEVEAGVRKTPTNGAAKDLAEQAERAE